MSAESLKRQTVSGMAWGIGSKLLLIVSNVIVLMVTSRTLNAVEFGVFAAGTIFIDLSVALATAGFGVAVVQKLDVSQEELDASLSGTLLASIVLAALLILLSSEIEGWLDTPHLQPTLIAIACFIPVKLAAGIYGSCLQREAKHKIYQLSQSLPQTASGILVTVVMAMLGYGTWALVGGFAAGAVLELIMVMRGTSLAPKLTLNLRPLTNLMHVSAATVTNRMIVFVGSSADRVFAASLLGTATLGLYTRATSLAFVPTKLLGMPLDRVLLSSFSQVQNNQVKLGRALGKILDAQGVVLVPVSIGLAVATPLLVSTILGSKWLEIVPAAQILFLSVVARLGYIASEKAAVAVGQAWGATGRQASVAVALFVGAAIGSHFSLVGLAVGVTLARMLFYALSLNYAARQFAVKRAELVAAHGRGILIGTAGWAAAALLDHFFPAREAGLLAELVKVGAFGLAVSFCFILGPSWLVGRPLAELRSDAWHRLREFRRMPNLRNR